MIMNKEKAINFVLSSLEISSFDGLSVSYDSIKQNGKIVLNRKFSDEFERIKSLIENIWEMEACEKRIDKLIGE